jgi:hypothetical protein
MDEACVMRESSRMKGVGQVNAAIYMESSTDAGGGETSSLILTTETERRKY